MLDPGAKISTHGPKFENELLLSSMVDAATVIALGSLQGDVRQAFALSFPADTTITIPSFLALATAAFKATL